MSRITRDSFIGTLGSGGQGLDLDDLDAKTASALAAASITPDELAGIAGGDHRISTSDELGRLFDLIDRVDHDGSRGSIATTTRGADGQSRPTAGGAVFDALKNQLEAARLGGSGAAAAHPDPTKLPSPETCAKSLAAIAARGFTDVHLRPVPYMNQGTGAWAHHPYPTSPPTPGSSREIHSSGCAPTSLAMLDCGLRDGHTSPTATADFAVKNHLSGAPGGGGTDTPGLARAWASAYGLSLTPGTSRDQSKNVEVLKAGLDAGGVALVSVGRDPKTGKGHFTSESHVMVVNGRAMRNGEEWFAIANPGRADQTHASAALLTVDANVDQIAGAANGVGRVWISKTQLEAEMERCFVFNSGVAS